jgi:glyoxylase-like metal-dependent hydrolase (beta-lactamase superfamily II)
MPLIRESFSVGLLGCTCSIVACPETRQALVVDPGDQAADILAALDRLGVSAVKIVHTHAHFDHVMATGAVAAATGAEVLLHRGDRWLYDNVEMQARFFGLPWPPEAQAPPAPTRELDADEALPFGRREARALHTPGHTPGSTCFFLERAGETPILFAGDTLFRRSIGRTDLWGGSFDEIAASIRDRLFTLPADTIVIPGHGPPTTIGAERELNPYVGAKAGQ